MIGLLQRVKTASVRINGEVVARCDQGLLVLVGVCAEDQASNATRLAARILGYRVFEDANGKMNKNLCEVNGGLILVPQFTLAADTQSGMRASFTSAAAPAIALPLFNALVDEVKKNMPNVQTGVFGADMQVALINDGPITFRLEA